MDGWVPRYLESVLVEEGSHDVTVTFVLGDVIPGGWEEIAAYGVYYYGADGEGGKRFGVNFSTSVSAYVFDNGSSTQSNYPASAVRFEPDVVVVTFNDASLGADEVGTIAAFSLVDLRDVQMNFPVTLLR